jgi:hypothetical protein
MRTLADHLAAGGEWPDVLEPYDGADDHVCVCRCGLPKASVEMYDVAHLDLTPDLYRCGDCLAGIRVRAGLSRAEMRAKLEAAA